MVAITALTAGCTSVRDDAGQPTATTSTSTSAPSHADLVDRVAAHVVGDRERVVVEYADGERSEGGCRPSTRARPGRGARRSQGPAGPEYR